MRSVTRHFFVNFVMHSPKRYLNEQNIVTNALSENKICNLPPLARRRVSPSLVYGSPFGVHTGFVIEYSFLISKTKMSVFVVLVLHSVLFISNLIQLSMIRNLVISLCVLL